MVATRAPAGRPVGGESGVIAEGHVAPASPRPSSKERRPGSREPTTKETAELGAFLQELKGYQETLKGAERPTGPAVGGAYWTIWQQQQVLTHHQA